MAANSTSASTVRQTVNGEADPFHTILNDGIDEVIRKGENWLLMPEIEDENGSLRVLVDPKYLPRPRAPQAPVVVQQASLPSKLDELYKPHFRRLERDLEAPSSHVPASVTEGWVATLSFQGRVSTEGEAVFEPSLEDRVAAPAK